MNSPGYRRRCEGITVGSERLQNKHNYTFIRIILRRNYTGNIQSLNNSAINQEENESSKYYSLCFVIDVVVAIFGGIISIHK